MVIYLITFSIGIILAIFTWRRENRKMFNLLAGISIVLPGVRAITVGADTENYVRFFLNPSGGYAEDTREFEFAYLLWNDIIRFIWANGNFFLFLTSILSLSGVLFFVKNNSTYSVLSLLFLIIMALFWFLNFVALRQCIAISFFLLALHNFNLNTDNSRRKSAILYTISMLFHTTVLFTLPIILILNKVSISKKIAYILIAMSFIIGWFGLFEYRSTMKFGFTVLGGMFSKVDRYSSYDNFMANADIIDNHRIIWDMLPFTLLCFASYLYANRHMVSSLYLKLFLIGLILNNVMVSYPMRPRIVIYLLVLSIVAIPNIFRRTNIAAIVYTVTTVYFFYKTYSNLSIWTIGNPGPQLVPYNTLFN